MTGAALARAIAAGDTGAREVLETYIARIEATDARVNAFTGTSYARARKEADAVDAARARVIRMDGQVTEHPVQ